MPMELKSIVVTAAKDPRYHDRLDLAFTLAEMHDAHITVVHAVQSPKDVQSSGRAASAAYIDAMMETAIEKGKELERETLEYARSKKRTIEWVSGTAGLRETVTQEALLADLTIVGRSEDVSFEDWFRDHLVDYLARSVDTPILYLPPGADHLHLSKSVLIAWDGSNPAMRTVRACLPIVEKAKTVHVVSLGPVGGKPMDSGGTLAGYLEQHGISAEVHGNETAEIMIGAALLEMAEMLDVGLIVMGAHSKEKLRELIFGSVTRTVLRDCKRPILLSG